MSVSAAAATANAAGDATTHNPQPQPPTTSHTTAVMAVNISTNINMHSLAGGASGATSAAATHAHLASASSLTRSRNASVTSTHRVLPLPPPYTRAAWTLRLLALSLLVLIVLEAWLLGIMAWRQYKSIQRPPFAVAAVVATAVALVMHVYALVVRLGPRLSVGPAATAGGFWPLVFLVCVTMVSSISVALQAWLTDPHDHPLFYIVAAVNVPVVVLAVRGFVWLKTVEMRVRAASAQSGAGGGVGVLSKGSAPPSGTMSPVNVPLALVEEGAVGPVSTVGARAEPASTSDLPAVATRHIEVDVAEEGPMTPLPLGETSESAHLAPTNPDLQGQPQSVAPPAPSSLSTNKPASP
ncbi:hypothetical protein BCR44DRAFT_43180 [Catenaria anguillulae PL171]|uniref:Transmembrane protein n=1 Tax=Catenaria anguillulae PL171 TaxID=765915 RepID=A0A1Y2HFD1_9FUNG|nr:hypothetical protein BCR44DRAFT_43180 [Catenaria anguillulae PL171]